MDQRDFNFASRQLTVFLRDEADRSVFNEIFKFREYRMAEEVIKNARNPILDVGAHAGFFSIYCHALNPKAKIFALEPEPDNFAWLEKNLKANRIKTVKPVQAALAGETRRRQLALAADNHNHRLLRPGEKGGRAALEVDCYSLSDFCRKNKIKKISLLKMDIEGGEGEVFSNISTAETGMVNFIILEYHRVKECAEIEEKLRESGFGVQKFPSHFDKTMGFLFANNKRA